MFMNDISIVVRKMCVFAERNMVDEHLGFPEQEVLMYLEGHGSSTLEQMAAFFDLDRGALSKTLSKMEDKGLVTREMNVHDRRQKFVTPTDAGHQLMARMTEVLSAWDEGVCKGIAADDVATAERVIEAMAANASDMVKASRG